MNIVHYLLEQFFYEEKYNTLIIIVLSLVITLFQTNGISLITAKIIGAIEKGDVYSAVTNYKYFIMLSLAFLAIYYVYKTYQNHILMKMMQWIKHEILKIILTINNVNMSHVNFIEFITPITRISVSCYVLFYDVISVIIPTTAFLLVIFGYFVYKNTTLGLFFILANAAIVGYVLYFWNSMLEQKNNHETKINDNEKYIVDILNNIDKVIYRGQNTKEIENYADKTSEGIKVAENFIGYVTMHTTIMTVFVYIIIFMAIGYLIKLHSEKKIDTTIFITFFTMMLLYRDRSISTIHNIPDYLEFIGRLNFIVLEFNRMLGDKDISAELTKSDDYASHNIPFDHIRYEHVYFKYDKTDKMILSDFNIDLDLRDKIIGIVGLSGNGKSSFVKLMLRLYDCNEGRITIDGVSITDIDPNYIRENVTYVNQSAKLFDKKIMENIMYGCNDVEKCDENLREILQHNKIRELYKNVDLENTYAGSLGENLSGGQRQVINIISGLINPSKILILDEPTNALDGDLKRQILAILNNSRKYKKCIIIITHDEDVHPLFDETIKI
jgi:ABC-type bacteriocin/lantibiotic exporter with double-glycine peptidase domain